MKNTLAKLLSTAALAGLGTLALPSANAVILQFNSATTTDGGTISGVFTLTGTVGGPYTISAVNFTTSVGSAVTQPHTYVAGDTADLPSFITFYDNANFNFPPSTAYVTLQLTGAGIDWDDVLTAPLGSNFTIKTRTKSPFTVPSSEYVSKVGGDQLRGISGGFMTVVPEPSTYAMVAGLGMVAFGLYRRFGQKA